MQNIATKWFTLLLLIRLWILATTFLIFALDTFFSSLAASSAVACNSFWLLIVTHAICSNFSGNYCDRVGKNKVWTLITRPSPA